MHSDIMYEDTWKCYCLDRWNKRYVWGGTSYMWIFLNAMYLLFYQGKSDSVLRIPGLLYKGQLFSHAQDVVKANGGKSYGFEIHPDKFWDPLNVYFSLGRFWIYQDIPGWERGLYIWGTDPDFPNAYASADVTGNGINVNAALFIQTAQRLKWPNNSTGADYLVWLTAAKMFHEIIHNMGFDHPLDVDYTYGSDYASSLPFVAEQAVLRASPYWNIFEPYYKTASWLVPPNTRDCGMRRNGRPTH